MRMEKIKVTKQQMEAATNEIWAGYWENVATMPQEEREKISKELWEKTNQLEMVLQFPPQHPNANINALINRYCDDSRIKEDIGVIYSGGQVGGIYIDDFGRPRLELPDRSKWIFVDEWCNGYREVWVNESDRVTVTICEGDLSIVICKDMKAFAKQLAGAIECYGVAEGITA